MWQAVGIYVTLMVVCAANVQAAVIRPEDQQEMTTPKAMEEEASTTVEPAESTTVIALSRDKDATVHIEERESFASLDPAPGTIEGELSVRLDEKPQKQQQQQQQQKSAKLLLLSTPSKRTHEVELQLEEQDENESAAAGSGEASVRATTEQEVLDNTTTETTTATIDRKAATPATEATTTITTEAPTTTTATEAPTTKLFAINATTSSKDSSEPNSDNATISIAEQPQPVGNNNVAIELALTEPEAEYVLLDTDGLELASVSSTSVTHDELQLGSFTHIDSDVHLQPVVHSVEIVPTRFDDPLIVNYVHNFR